jgi:hypothetical protein
MAAKNKIDAPEPLMTAFESKSNGIIIDLIRVIIENNRVFIQTCESSFLHRLNHIKSWKYLKQFRVIRWYIWKFKVQR